MDKIKVAIRLRPFNKREVELGALNAVSINENQVILNNNSTRDGKNNPKSFTFDVCFDSSKAENPNYATQQNVYDGLGLEVLESSMAGYNACIFAYGQTGSGKSFTMMGSQSNKGLIPRLCEDIFNRIAQNSTKNLTFKVEVSYIEIYNEKVRDLLDPSGSKLNLKVREHQLLGPYVDGLTHLAVSSYKDIETILNEGNKSRTVAATNMNAESSRSHAVFCLKLYQTILDEQIQISGEKVSRISLVDLAGSEKVSKTGVEGERLKEGCNINKSLHTLGQVISALADSSSSKSKQKHIPYRDSVLTWLLKDSIGGNSKTVMVSAISPSLDNYEETLSTLRYADRAKRIVNNAVVNEDPNAKIIRNLREEVENLKKELEKAKEQINAELINDRLQQSEKLYQEISKPWNEKLAETEKIQQEWDSALQQMGISVQSSGIKVEKDKYYLVNLNADPSLNELLVYYLKDLTLVGRPDAINKQDIQLMGPGIAYEHCAFYFKNNYVCIAPIKEANTWVNGKLIRGETVLHHGDRIVLGINHFFRINCPTDNNTDRMNRSEIDFNRAQEEVLLENKNLNSPNWIEGDSMINIDDESKSTSSIFSNTTSSDDNNTLALELAIQKFEQEYSASTSSRIPTSSSSQKISNSPSTSSINKSLGKSEVTDSGFTTSSKLSNDIIFRKGLQKLRNKILRANSLCREANSLCKEMNKLLRFSVTLQIPAYNLTPSRDPDSLLSEPAIVVKNKYPDSLDEENNQNQKPNKIIIDLEKFESYIYHLREIYTERRLNNLPLKDSDENPRKPDIFTNSISYYYNLIGVANLFLDVLYNDLFIPFEYNIPIINQQGEIAGRLKVRIQRLNTETDLNNTSDDSESLLSEPSEKDSDIETRRFIKVRLNILQAFDLPLNLNNLVFCQYQFWGQKLIIASSQNDANNSIKSSIVNFNHENEFIVETNEDFLEYCQYRALSIEVMCHRCNLSQSFNSGKIENLNNLNQQVKYQALIDAWSEVSKSFELKVKILELNQEGLWRPVSIKQNEYVKTGGVYQLKQGQSRQISVTLTPVKPNTTMWYNGLMFNLEPHKIDKISVGCIQCLIIGETPLDSYQETELNRLKEKCKEILEKRKQYLYSQLKQLSDDNKSEEDKERYESICSQLVNLGEEQAAIDAPNDDSHLPGSTIKWTPQTGMEQHVPVMFLDLSDEIETENLNLRSDTDYSDNDDDFELSRKKKNLALKTFGEECYLKYERKDTQFLSLKIISWNDSNSVEMIESSTKFEFDETDSPNSLKAVARWDSTEHGSQYLNKETPIDRIVYLTVKINLKLKIINPVKNDLRRANQYVDLVLRKRLCVTVNSSLNTNLKLLGLNKLKGLLGSTATLNRNKFIKSSGLIERNDAFGTTITYRVISNIPRLLTEIENRESLAIKVANSIAEDLIELNEKQDKINQENSMSLFEQYAKTIEAVDSILKRDRIQQQIILKKSIIYFSKNGMEKNEDFDMQSSDENHSNNEPSMKKTFSVPNLLKVLFFFY
ncbi:unnamed protein product [Brachionus calyciflorus]|uniref:Kinesin motor domain-containing protein n=1 Tax=Brachionus calyciflorus TaxID=104777 RepID=A0A813LVB2_9BILA|nr:unnamed protein product [Brachionus calyciflorus]